MADNGDYQFSIGGKVIIITGAYGGIGSALAKGLSESGAILACIGRDAVKLDELTSSLPGRSIGIKADVTSESEVNALVENVLKEFGRIDVLINNAGIHKAAMIADMSLDDWNNVIQVNLNGTFLCSRAVIKPMREQGSGCIINMTSALGQRGNPTAAAYAASKAGVSNFTNVLYQEVADFGIRVIGIAPGLTDTPLVRGNRDEEYIKKLASLYPGGRLGQPGDAMGLVQFLCSDAAKYINGTVVFMRP